MLSTTNDACYGNVLNSSVIACGSRLPVDVDGDPASPTMPFSALGTGTDSLALVSLQLSTRAVVVTVPAFSFIMSSIGTAGDGSMQINRNVALAASVDGSSVSIAGSE